MASDRTAANQGAEAEAEDAADRAGAPHEPAARRSLVGEVTRIGLVLLAVGLAATLVVGEVARRAAAANLADFQMIDFLNERVAPGVALCAREDIDCLTQVYAQESGGFWRLRGADGVLHQSFSFGVSDFARDAPDCVRRRTRRIQGFRLYTCAMPDLGADYRVAERAGGDQPALIALESEIWAETVSRAGAHLVTGRSVGVAIGAMALALLAVLAASVLTLRIALRRQFGRLGAELDAYRVGAATRVDGAYSAEIAAVVASLNRAIDAKASVLARQKRNVAKMAHDLRHQLVAIDLAARGSGADEGAPDKAVLATELETLGRLVERYLTLVDWVGPAEGAPQASVSAALDATAKGFSRRLRASPVAFEVDAPEDLTARVHPADLNIILANLVGNAFKHADGRIRLAARREVDAVIVTVDDDGPGVAPEDRARALDWGERLDNAPAGSGFGLAIVAEQTRELYGGDLTLGDAALGGLRVEVRLPL